MVNMATCEGMCRRNGECSGEVRRVLVWHGTHCFGGFWYCDTARNDDENRGLTVMSQEDLDDILIGPVTRRLPMPMTPEEKHARKRARMIEKAKEYQTSTYCRKFVANVFQKMIRAESAAILPWYDLAVVDGEVARVYRKIGQVVCVTCGKVCRWDDFKQINTGHFIAGRSNSILFEEDNVAPQCVHCNLHLSGNQSNYRKWMLYVRGPAVVEHLERLKQQSVSFSKPELVDMRIDYTRRLKAAEARMKG